MTLAPLRTRKTRMKKICAALAQQYPDTTCPLDVQTPLEVLVATILSAQCTDKKVNEVLPALFQKYPDIRAYANAQMDALIDIIRPIGLYRAKAKNIIGAAQTLLDAYGGIVPESIDELTTLPGVGRKTANCVLVNGYNKPGIMCDTHCCRVTRRLGLHEESDPVKIEFALAELMPPEAWGDFSHRIILHGREICKARTPRCDACPLRRLCDTGKQ